ncbi:MAG: 30S ribosomal protein S5 [Metamycoplasmataceae bacterium]
MTEKIKEIELIKEAKEEIKKTEVVSAIDSGDKVNIKEKVHFETNETKFKPRAKNSPKGGDNKKRSNFKQKPQSEFEERIVDIARVTVVVKGGRRFSFSAVVAVGNKKGLVGLGHGKANEVPDAIKKAVKAAQANLIKVPIIDKSSIPHEVSAKYLASHILIKPARKGKGVIASGTVRNIMELAGYTDIYTKTYGSRNKTNISKVTLRALSKLRTLEEVAKLRDISPEKVLN